ncbi:hypothetical protein [Streptomyces regalis]|uniref:hypothetical protein n=1 Tax=Streptomyces regalis TaxID=68262 RepID=UPI000A9E2DD2|nr:hypothetical protein [Streptomyces regalis]
MDEVGGARRRGERRTALTASAGSSQLGGPARGFVRRTAAVLPEPGKARVPGRRGTGPACGSSPAAPRGEAV